MIRVLLPYHLRTLARVDSEVLLEVKSPPTLSAVLDALEAPPDSSLPEAASGREPSLVIGAITGG